MDKRRTSEFRELSARLTRLVSILPKITGRSNARADTSHGAYIAHLIALYRSAGWSSMKTGV